MSLFFMMRCAILKLIFFGVLFFFVSSSFGQQKEGNKYVRYIDSADIYVAETPKIAEKFLDSIPNPIAESIDGYLANYYQLRGLIADRTRNQAKLFQDYRLAMKYGEIEKNYDIAGMASLELFTNTYFIKKDSTAFKYLEKAKEYYSKSNNKNGLAEVKLMPAYVAFINKDNEASNALILKNIEEYRAIQDDAYYHLLSVFMLTSNYMKLNDFKNAFKYRKEFESLKNNETISYTNYVGYEVGLNGTMAHKHFNKNHLDSTFFYLEKNKAFSSSMNYNNLQDHYRLYVKAYKEIGDDVYFEKYMDSLVQFEKKLLQKTMDAGLNTNATLAKTETQLEEERKEKQRNSVFIWVLAIVLIGFALIVVTRYKKIRQRINEFTKRNEEYTYMQTNHEKLQVKVRGLEDYLNDVKKEIKSISKINDTPKQRERIKELYKDLHLNSSTVLDKSKNHLELVNDLNIDFFNTMNSKHPELDDSEIIICYYLYIGFKNKEIAVFLNRSLRSIENKRFRIGKKLHLKAANLNLLEYLNALFIENKKVV